jgi:hypothetical protein
MSFKSENKVSLKKIREKREDSDLAKGENIRLKPRVERRNKDE